jgi:hypothetical protein
MKTTKETLLNLLNEVILNSTDVINQILNRDTEIENIDIFDIELASKLLIRNLEFLDESL